jgi:hypothetical protein
MAHVPRLTNLTNLNVSGALITDEELASGVSALPLRKLTLWNCFIQGSCYAKLPPTLKSIRLGEVSGEAKWLSGLPSGVRSLKVCILTDAHLRGLPPRLRSLCTFSLQLASPSSLALLPSTLTRLDVPHLATGDFALLPPSLLRLRLGENRCIRLDASVRMPPRLEVLEIGLAAATTEDQMGSLCSALPRLRALTLDWLAELPLEAWRHLSTLTSLRTLRLKRATTDGSFLAFLPASLFRLDLTPPALDVSWLRFLPARVLCQYVDGDGERTTVVRPCTDTTLRHGAIIEREDAAHAEEPPRREKKRKRKETTLLADAEGER